MAIMSIHTLEAEPGEILTTTQQRGNVHDHFAVAVKKK